MNLTNMEIDKFIQAEKKREMGFWTHMSDLDDELLLCAYKSGMDTENALNNLIQAEMEVSNICL